MSHSLATYKQADCERREPVAGDMPPFRFVPDDPHKRPFVTLPVYDRDGKKEMELKI